MRLLLLAFLPLLMAAAPVNRDSFVGFWYGIGEPDDPNVFYIDNYHADGTFNSEFRKCVNGREIWRETASGTWKVQNGVLMMVSDKVNGENTHFEHNYDIERLTFTEFHARYHDPDYLFVENRVSSFNFPPCYLGS